MYLQHGNILLTMHVQFSEFKLITKISTYNVCKNVVSSFGSWGKNKMSYKHRTPSQQANAVCILTTIKLSLDRVDDISYEYKGLIQSHNRLQFQST